MKLVRASKGPVNRAEAWTCLTANLALPGSGSLAAGKSVGYFQLALAFLGLLVSVISGIPMLKWIPANWDRIQSPNADPFDTLSILWNLIRWPLAGIGIFAVALAWSVMTGMRLLAEHPKNPAPPRIPQ